MDGFATVISKLLAQTSSFGAMAQTARVFGVGTSPTDGNFDKSLASAALRGRTADAGDNMAQLVADIREGVWALVSLGGGSGKGKGGSASSRSSESGYGWGQALRPLWGRLQWTKAGQIAGELVSNLRPALGAMGIGGSGGGAAAGAAAGAGGLAAAAGPVGVVVGFSVALASAVSGVALGAVEGFRRSGSTSAIGTPSQLLGCRRGGLPDQRLNLIPSETD